jgi:predicted transcriptional regulator
MNQLTIRISDQLRRDLENLCQQENSGLNELVREALRRFVAVERFRALRKVTLPCAEAHGFFTDDDVFKSIS